MATVVDDVTGEEVQVVEAQAVAAMASVNSIHNEFPPGAGKRIEEAMAAAATNAQVGGITDPYEIKQLMLKARESVKAAMRIEMNDLRSQAAAAEREHERIRSR